MSAQTYIPTNLLETIRDGLLAEMAQLYFDHVAIPSMHGNSSGPLTILSILRSATISDHSFRAQNRASAVV